MRCLCHRPCRTRAAQPPLRLLAPALLKRRRSLRPPIVPPCALPCAHCGSSTALCSSGRAAMISTSLGPRSRAYLSWACGGGRKKCARGCKLKPPMVQVDALASMRAQGGNTQWQLACKVSPAAQVALRSAAGGTHVSLDGVQVDVLAPLHPRHQRAHNLRNRAHAGLQGAEHGRWALLGIAGHKGLRLRREAGWPRGAAREHIAIARTQIKDLLGQLRTLPPPSAIKQQGAARGSPLWGHRPPCPSSSVQAPRRRRCPPPLMGAAWREAPNVLGSPALPAPVPGRWAAQRRHTGDWTAVLRLALPRACLRACNRQLTAL